MKLHLVPLLCGALALAWVACSQASSPKTGGTGGQTATTSTSGGSSGTGGVSASGGLSGGGGATSTGGVAGSGGTTAATGGAPSTGGNAGSGGATGRGGSASGGATGAGGARTDGATGAGGTSLPDTGATGGRTDAGRDGAAGSGGGPGTGDATASGGARTGGATSTGGATATGGATGTGGAASGGATGSGGGAGGFKASYLIGADISFVESASSAGQDSLLSQLQAHGFNAIRLRTFVDPKAADGYDKTSGTCDLAHTISFGKQVKDRGMALLVDFHYSDNWADPSKQCVPVAWQGLGTIDELAGAVYEYTKDSVTKLIAGGARPEMVQVGNEITPGMLMHVCNSSGEPTGSARVTGASSNWTNLGKLLKAGVKGVKDVDPAILTVLHIDRCGDKTTETPGSALSTSKWFIDNAVKQGVTFEVFGESCYQRYQGDPNNPITTKAGWTNTFNSLAAAYPNLKLIAAEYGPMQREINDVVFAVPNRQGIGTFNWEPEKEDFWNTGHALFTWSGNTFTPQPDLALYDQMKIDYAGRL